MGKTSAIKKMLEDGRLCEGDPSLAVAGEDARGVTKGMNKFRIDLPEVGTLIIRDAPGIGDMDKKPFKLMQMYEKELEGQHVDALLLFLNADNPRFDMVAQVTTTLMDIAFPDKGADKWKSFIVVGTHKDKAGAAKCQKFKENGEIKACIQEMVGRDVDVAHLCCTSKDDLSELYMTLTRAFNSGGLGKFEKPTASSMIRGMGKVLDVPEEEMVQACSKDGDMREFMMQMMRERTEADKANQARHDALVGQLMTVLNRPAQPPAKVPIPVPCSTM